MCGRSVAHDINPSSLIEKVAPLKGRRGIEIDFAGLTVGCTYGETLYLLFITVVTLAALRTHSLYLVGCQFCMADYLADNRYAVHEKVQVETDLSCYGAST